MNKVKVLIIATSVLLLSGCSTTTAEIGSDSQGGSTTKSVTQANFDEAISQMKVTVDEFNGGFAIAPENVKTLADLAGNTNAVSDIGIYLANGEEGRKPWTYLSVTYFAKEWLFFESFELKSSTATFYLPVQRADKTEKVEDDGYVSERALVELSADQVNELSKLLQGDGVKFRLTGSGSETGQRLVEDLSATQILKLKNGVTISKGFDQGFTIQ